MREYGSWGCVGANGAPPSMGNDDYKADLDAVNIYYRIKQQRLR